MIAELTNARGESKGNIEKRHNPLSEKVQYDWAETDQWANRQIKKSFDSLEQLDAWLRQRRWKLGPWRYPEPADAPHFYL